MNLEERERRVLAETSKVRALALPVVAGDGSFLVTEDGRRLLDLSATFGAAALGYSHPAVAEAVARAARSMASATNVTTTNPEAVQLAEALVDLMPPRDDWRVWFGHCGSDANDAVARSIAAATGRSRFVSFIGAAHGGSSGSLALSGYSGLQLGTVGGARAGQVFALYPDTFRPPLPVSTDDLSGACLEHLRFLLDNIASPGEIGAVFVEPIMCDAGDVVPPPGFLRGLSELCQSRDILLVCDEVKVGLGRTGLMHAFAHEGITPDIVTFGKAIGGGLPLAAAVGPAHIMNAARGLTVTTVAGNPVSCAAGRAVLQTIAAERLVENARDRGNQFLDGLRKIKDRHPVVGDVRGRGLVIGIDFVEPGSSRAPAEGLASRVSQAALRLGAVAFSVGHQGNVLELTPPLTVSAAEVALALDILDQAIAQAEAA